MRGNVILATISDESQNRVRSVDIRQYNAMLNAHPPDKDAIAEMIYHRFHGRYIKPFLFDDRRYKKHYKNGFSMMASACLLIETLESFYQGLAETPKGENGQMFESFFRREMAFIGFRHMKLKFYKHIRCGIMHQAETTGGFTITRRETAPLLREKEINAQKFLTTLVGSLLAYRKRLQESEWDSEIWDNFRRKMRFIIENCQID